MKKGFTLVELLGVLVLLSVLALITVPIVNGAIKKSKEKSVQIQLESIVKSAKAWAAADPNRLPEQGKERLVTLQELKQAGFVDGSIKNPKTKKEFPNTLQVKISYDLEYQSYTYEIVESTM